MVQASITDFIEYKERLRNIKATGEEALKETYSKQIERHLEIISNLCTDKSKSFEYLKRISNIKDNNLFKVLDKYSGLSSTIEVNYNI